MDFQPIDNKSRKDPAAPGLTYVWISFIQQNARWLVGCFIIFFFSAFGQSYVVSLNFEEIKAIHGFTDGDLGLINTVATFVSGGLILALGGLADRFPARLMVAASFPILAVAAFLYQLDAASWVFFTALFLLRFAAQGLMTHVAFTLVGRWFEASRGRAVAITSAGQTIGQMAVPFGFVVIAATIGWQQAWIGVSVFLIAITPLVAALLWVERKPEGGAGGDIPHGIDRSHEGFHPPRGAGGSVFLCGACRHCADVAGGKHDFFLPGDIGPVARLGSCVFHIILWYHGWHHHPDDICRRRAGRQISRHDFLAALSGSPGRSLRIVGLDRGRLERPRIHGVDGHSKRLLADPFWLCLARGLWPPAPRRDPVRRCDGHDMRYCGRSWCRGCASRQRGQY